MVAHMCGDPLSRYTCRATRVAAGFLGFLGFSRCSSSRTSSCLCKSVALQGVIAATLAGIALLCATKGLTISMATAAEPHGEKQIFYCANFGP